MAIDLEKINDSDHILDILIQCEDILDSLDIYVYKNWFQGEIISGPFVKRYWIEFGLGYPLDKMPDPTAALRLTKYGIKVKFEKMHRKGKEVFNLYTQEAQPTDDDQIWMITITIPRRLIDDVQDSDDFYDNEEGDLETDDIESAKDNGLDDESQIKTDEQNPDGSAPPPDMGGDQSGQPAQG